MEPTRRVWLVVAIAGAGLVLAAMFSNPLLLGVPVGVGTWILAHQLAFVRSLTQIQQSDPPIIAQSLSDTGSTREISPHYTSSSPTRVRR